MQIFLLNNTDGQKGWLNQKESKHCLKVLRHKPGDEIHTIDGLGNMFLARIESQDKLGLELTLLEKHENWGEHQVNISLAVSPLRLKDRFEWLMEKSVELGVNEIYPITCQRTDKYKAKFKEERIEKILFTALKQCMRSKKPILHPIQPIKSFIETHNSEGKFLASGKSELPFQRLAAEMSPFQSVCILIGPEGDFTEAEFDLAIENGFSSVSLGSNRLRTETAGVYGLSVLKMVYGY